MDTHCVHWWDGDGTTCDHGSPACAKCRATSARNVEGALGTPGP